LRHQNQLPIHGMPKLRDPNDFIRKDGGQEMTERIKLTEDKFNFNEDTGKLEIDIKDTDDLYKPNPIIKQILDDQEKSDNQNSQDYLGGELIIKLEQDIKQLKEELKTTDELWKNQCQYRLNAEKREENLKEKLEKIGEWFVKNDNKGIGNKDWQELKKILDYEPRKIRRIE